MRVLPEVTPETFVESTMLLPIDGTDDFMRKTFAEEQPYLSKKMNQYAALSEVMLEAPGVKEFMQTALASLYYNIRTQVQTECNAAKPSN